MAVLFRPNTGLNIDVAKPLMYSREINKISEFLTTYKNFIRIKMRNDLVEEQV